MARRMLLQEASLRETFERRLREDRAFAADPRARLRLHFRREVV